MRPDPLTHPVTLAAMGVLAVNDHWAKGAYPGLVTGKLSDFAGLVFFPLLVEALGVSRAIAVLVSGVGFTLVKAWPDATAAWNAVFSPLYALVGLGARAGLHGDPTDLIALVALLVPLFLLPRRSPCPDAASSS